LSTGSPDWQTANPRWDVAACAWRPEGEAASEAALRDAYRHLDALPAAPQAGLDAAAAARTALDACRRAGRWKDMLQLFDAMKKAELARDVRSYEHALTSAMVLERFDLALALWQEMRSETTLQPSARGYNAAMSALERSGRAAEALALGSQMESDGVAPDSDTAHVLISACEKQGAAATALLVLGRLEAVGARPPARLYESAMRAAAASDDGPRAASLLARMRALKVPRTPATYAAAIGACGGGPAAAGGAASGGAGGTGAGRGSGAGASGAGGAASRGRGTNGGGASAASSAGPRFPSPAGRAKDPLLGLTDGLLKENTSLVRAVLGDASAVTALLEACAKGGKPSQALALLSAATGAPLPVFGSATSGVAPGSLSAVPGSDAAPDPAHVTRWRRLALRACAAGPYGSEARSLLHQLGSDATPLALSHAVAASAASREWREALKLYSQLRELAPASSGVAPTAGLHTHGSTAAGSSVGRRDSLSAAGLSGPGDEGSGALAAASVAAIVSHGKLRQLDEAAAVFGAAWPSAHAGIVAASGGGAAGIDAALAASSGGPAAGSNMAQGGGDYSSGGASFRLVDAYNALLLACLECDDPQRTLSLLAAMRAQGAAPNALSLTSAIAAAQRLGQHEQVIQKENTRTSGPLRSCQSNRQQRTRSHL